MKKKKNFSLELETKVAQALRFIDDTTGAVTPNIQLSATYARDENYDNRSLIGTDEMVMKRLPMQKK